tara:strand:- start:1078 stop:1308 length:231 start_codon:yes stop_codon:yes gene_type:complete
MAKFSDWYYQNDQDWLSEHPEPMHDDESELEVRILEWNGDNDWGELLLVAICLECGNALTGYSKVFGFRFCEVCEV